MSARSDYPEVRGLQLAEELEQTLNRKFESTADFREAVEAAQCHFGAVLHGLDEDQRRAEADRED